MLFHEVHKQFNGGDGYGKSRYATDNQISDFCARHTALFQEEFEKLVSACADHRGDGKDESEFGRRRSVYAQKQCADDGDARTGSAGDCRKQLETTDEERVFIRKLGKFGNFRVAFFVAFLYDDKNDAVNNQGASDGERFDKLVFFA